MEVSGTWRWSTTSWSTSPPTSCEVWERVRFDVLFKGDDWRGTPKGDKLEADMATVGVRVVYFPYTVHTSSTLLRSLLTQP